MNRKRYSFVLLFFVLALVMACSGTDEVPEQPAQQTTTARTEAEPATSETADAVEPELDEEAEDEGVDVEEAPAEPVAKVDETKPAPVKPDVKGDLKDASVLFSEAPAEFRARFETTKGDFVVNLTREWSPKGVDHFYHLVKLGYYDDIAFFRAIEGFMVQFGIHGDPEINAVWSDANIDDEPVKASNKRGFLTYAKSRQPNSRSTQLYINLTDNLSLDSMGFSPIGQVVEGMSVVDSLHTGYGEGAPRGRGPSQQAFSEQGNALLKKQFPELDYIKRVVILD
jgi:peptidyl-prolyl cis-trans isomerase A (cyclophilin A)